MTQITQRSFEPNLLEEVSLALPVGVVLPYVGHATPDEFLFCNGQAVSRTTYAKLFQVLGTYYGVGDGSTTFNVPDLRGRGIVGNRTMSATDSGNECGNSALLGIDAYHDPAPTVLGTVAGQDLCFNFIIKVKADFPGRTNAYPTAP